MSGVMIGAARVEHAVIVTDSATLPFARYVITFDEIPPGLAPSNTMPNINSGGSPKANEMLHPKKGITENCNTNPTKTAIGILRTRTKSATVNVAPIPNIAI